MQEGQRQEEEVITEGEPNRGTLTDRWGQTRTRYLTADIGAVALKQDGHVTATASVHKGKDVAGPWRETKRLSGLPRAAGWPSHAAPTPLNAIRVDGIRLQSRHSPLHASTHGMGSNGGQAGGLSPSVWFCRKSTIVRLTVCSSRSGPAGRRAIVTARSATAPGPHPAPHGHGQDAPMVVDRPRWVHRTEHTVTAVGTNGHQGPISHTRRGDGAFGTPWLTLLETRCPRDPDLGTGSQGGGGVPHTIH